MWKCKKCGAEIVGYLGICSGLIKGKLDEDFCFVIDTEEIVDYESCDEKHYKCDNCGESSYSSIEKIAEWRDE